MVTASEEFCWVTVAGNSLDCFGWLIRAAKAMAVMKMEYHLVMEMMESALTSLGPVNWLKGWIKSDDQKTRELESCRYRDIVELSGRNHGRKTGEKTKKKNGTTKTRPGTVGLLKYQFAPRPGLDGLSNKLARSDSWGGTITRQWHRLSPVDHSLKLPEADGVSPANQILRLVARHTPLPRNKDRSGCYQKPSETDSLNPDQSIRTDSLPRSRTSYSHCSHHFALQPSLSLTALHRTRDLVHAGIHPTSFTPMQPPVAVK